MPGPPRLKGRWKAELSCLALVLTIACGGKGQEGGGSPNSGAGTGPASTSLGSVQGSYVHPPAHNRVIVFVNGIFGDGTGTWTNGTTGKYWPALLAADSDFADVDVYVHSFVSPPWGTPSAASTGPIAPAAATRT